MQVEIKVPVLPESVAEGTLGDWHKQVGDSVAVEENIVDLETDKVVLEIVASKAGVIESIAFESGATVKNGDVLGVIDTEAAASAPAAAAPQQEMAETSEADDATTDVEESTAARKLTHKQQKEQIEAAKSDGVTFIALDKDDKDSMVKASESLYATWGEKIGVDYLDKVRKAFPQN